MTAGGTLCANCPVSMLENLAQGIGFEGFGARRAAVLGLPVVEEEFAVLDGFGMSEVAVNVECVCELRWARATNLSGDDALRRDDRERSRRALRRGARLPPRPDPSG